MNCSILSRYKILLDWTRTDGLEEKMIGVGNSMKGRKRGRTPLCTLIWSRKHFLKQVKPNQTGKCAVLAWIILNFNYSFREGGGKKTKKKIPSFFFFTLLQWQWKETGEVMTYVNTVCVQYTHRAVLVSMSKWCKRIVARESRLRKEKKCPTNHNEIEPNLVGSKCFAVDGTNLNIEIG